MNRWPEPASEPRAGPAVWMDSAELRWAHDKIQRLVTCRRRLEDVVTDLRRGTLRPRAMHIIEIVQYEEKRYRRNNRRRWCCREAAVIAVQVRVGWAARAPLRGLTTRTDGLSVVFYPPTACNACGEEYANRTSLHNHDCGKRPELAAPPALASRRRRPPAEPVLVVGEGVH